MLRKTLHLKHVLVNFSMGAIVGSTPNGEMLQQARMAEQSDFYFANYSFFCLFKKWSFYRFPFI